MDQRRLVLAFAISVVVLILYERFVLSKYTRSRPQTPVITGQITAEAPPQAAPEPGVVLEAVPPGEAAVTVVTDVLRARLTPLGARLISLELNRYRRDVAGNSPPLDLVAVGPELPLRLQIGGGTSDAAVVYTPDRSTLTLRGDERGAVVFRGQAPGGLALEKRFTFSGDGYVFQLSLEAAGERPPSAVGVVLTPIPAAGHQGGGSEVAIDLVDHRLEQTPVATLLAADAKSPKPRGGELGWAGFAAQYFLAALVPPGGGSTAEMATASYLVHEQACGPADLACAAGPKRGWRCAGDDRACESAPGSRDGACSACLVRVPVVRVDAPLDRGRVAFDVYMGPKDRAALVRAGHSLERALDFGYFWFIALPLLYALRVLRELTGNYGLAIILLTALVKVATIPLTRATFRNMKEMQKIQPQMERLRERFKKDQEALQREVMELYRRHRVNPLSGCLPMVLQIPVFIGLYNTLAYAIELRHAPFTLWINDLSAPDRLMVLGYGIPVLTLIMGASMFVQQWLTPAQGDPAQQRIMMITPLIFTFMFINFPAGLVLYWLVNNIFTIAQQYLMLRSSR